jgi:hypothetical protein
VSNNLRLGPDGQLSHALNVLRGLEFAGPLETRQQIAPGIFFSLDPESSNAVEVISTPGQLMEISLIVEEPGRWLTLNMGLGAADLSACKIVGFACRTVAAVTTTCRVCIRSGIEGGGHKDVVFPKTLVAYPANSLHLDVLDLEANKDIPARAPWREIVIFFDIASTTITIEDFRLIMV